MNHLTTSERIAISAPVYVVEIGWPHGPQYQQIASRLRPGRPSSFHRRNRCVAVAQRCYWLRVERSRTPSAQYVPVGPAGNTSHVAPRYAARRIATTDAPSTRDPTLTAP